MKRFLLISFLINLIFSTDLINHNVIFNGTYQVIINDLDFTNSNETFIFEYSNDLGLTWNLPDSTELLEIVPNYSDSTYSYNFYFYLHGILINNNPIHDTARTQIRVSLITDYGNGLAYIDDTIEPYDGVQWGIFEDGIAYINSSSFIYIQVVWGANINFVVSCNTNIGDTNQDCEINISDIVVMIPLILQEEPLTDEELSISDMNQDGVLNVVDIVMLVDIILQD